MSNTAGPLRHVSDRAPVLGQIPLTLISGSDTSATSRSDPPKSVLGALQSQHFEVDSRPRICWPGATIQGAQYSANILLISFTSLVRVSASMSKMRDFCGFRVSPAT